MLRPSSCDSSRASAAGTLSRATCSRVRVGSTGTARASVRPKPASGMARRPNRPAARRLRRKVSNQVLSRFMENSWMGGAWRRAGSPRGCGAQARGRRRRRWWARLPSAASARRDAGSAGGQGGQPGPARGAAHVMPNTVWSWRRCTNSRRSSVPRGGTDPGDRRFREARYPHPSSGGNRDDAGRHRPCGTTGPSCRAPRQCGRACGIGIDARGACAIQRLHMGPHPAGRCGSTRRRSGIDSSDRMSATTRGEQEDSAREKAGAPRSCRSRCSVETSRARTLARMAGYRGDWRIMGKCLRGGRPRSSPAIRRRRVAARAPGWKGGMREGRVTQRVR